MAATDERLERGHGPVTDLFPRAGDDRSPWALSDDQLALFEKNGYVKGGMVLNFMRPETRPADGDAPLLTGTPVIPRGEVVAGMTE